MSSEESPPFDRAVEVAWTFLRLGCLSFGGPVAHLGYFRADIVERRRWLDDARFADLVALSQFLPGPASSQLVFALGKHRAGWPGAALASLCFTLPSAALMIAFAFGVARLSDLSHARWLHGLKLAALPVVAQAVWSMGVRLCADRARALIAALSAATLLVVPSSLTQLAVISLGALAGWRLYHQPTPQRRDAHDERIEPVERRRALTALALFVALLLGLPFAAAKTGSLWLSAIDGFYRSGALVFGGGHVVLPLLRELVVGRGWLDDARFLAGYGAAQAIPGPLFTFAGFIGASMGPSAPSITGGLLALLAIFAPAWLLIAGALPFWHGLRAKAWAQAAIMGANASVVGVLLAALYKPVFTESVRSPRDVAAAILAFVLLERVRTPPWLVVLAMAAAGQWLL
ncbi:MAG: chromate efflux transporter [Polyangiales bacterium]